jgi:predicted double-glycine peptidase
MEIVQPIIDKMFEIAGYDICYNDIVHRQDEWYTEYTMTKAQEKEWLEWGADFIRNSNKWYKGMAEREMAMINLTYGLKTIE